MEPQRFILNQGQVSEGFAAAGITPPRSAFYSSLPAATGQLPELLQGGDGNLQPAARAMFETLASASLMLRFLNIAAGSSIAIETRLFGDAAGRFVVVARPDADHWDLALLPDRATALALLDGLVGASALEDLPDGFELELSITGLAVIVAMAQLTRLSELRAELDDAELVLDFLTAPVPMQYVEAAIAAERDRPDLGSPLSIFALASDGALFDALDGGLDRAIAELSDAGLLDDEGVLTGDGLALMALIKSRETISLLQCARRQGGELEADTLLFLHGRASLLTGAWRPGDGGRPLGLTLTTMTGKEVLGLIDTLLETPPASKQPQPPRGGFCPECGAGHGEGQKFCRTCGIKL